MGTLVPTSLCALMGRRHLGRTGVSRVPQEYLREPRAQPAGGQAWPKWGDRTGGWGRDSPSQIAGGGPAAVTGPPSILPHGGHAAPWSPSFHECSLALPTPSLSSREAASQADKSFSARGHVGSTDPSRRLGATAPTKGAMARRPGACVQLTRHSPGRAWR